MVVVKLYGVLESAAQRTTKLYVHSFDEAMRAIFANFPKLRQLTQKMSINILIDGVPLTFEDCLRPFRAERIDIMPAIGGGGPAILIVVGAMMSYGAAAIATQLFLSTAISLAMTAAIQSFIFNMGIALIAGGISQLLFAPPKMNAGAAAKEDTPSYTFNGAVNVTTQGNVVPIGFGRMRIGSVVIGANVQTYDIPIATNVTTPEATKPPPEADNSVPSSGYIDSGGNGA